MENVKVRALAGVALATISFLAAKGILEPGDIETLGALVAAIATAAAVFLPSPKKP